MISRIALSILIGLYPLIFFAQTIQPDEGFYKDLDRFLNQHVKGSQFDYLSVKSDPTDLLALLKVSDAADLTNLNEDEQLAFYINAYNLNVLKSIILAFPVASTNEIPGFFDKKEHRIAGTYMTLDFLENQVIRKDFEQPLIHFALNCGAQGCPPLLNEAYRPEILETQLINVAKRGANDANFVRLMKNSKSVALSPIFDWFSEDFGGTKKSAVAFVNKYRNEKIPEDYSISFYNYDWALNNTGAIQINDNKPTDAVPTGNGDFRYIVAALYDRGEFEINLFNNLFYAQSENDGTQYTRSSTFNSLLGQFLYGINPRLNVGFDIRLRSVEVSNGETASAFNALSFPGSTVTDNGYKRTGLTAFGPKIKYAPFRKYGNISVQHTLYFPMGSQREGTEELGFIDWDGLSMLNQFFYDQQLGDAFGLFVEADFNLENINRKSFGGEEGTYFQISTPLTMIGSWYVSKSSTFYALMGSAPQWGFSYQGADENGDRASTVFYNPFSQYGLGFKYLIGESLQIELLYTTFHNGTGTKAETMNLGLRYIGQ